MNTRHVWLAGIAVGCFLVAPSATGQTLGPEELSAIVREQARTLKEQAAQLTALRAELASMQQKRDVVVAASPLPTDTSAVPPATLATGVPAQMPDAPRRSVGIANTRPAGVSEAPLTRDSAAQLAAAAKDGPVHIDWSEGGPVFASDDGRFVFRPRTRVILDANATGGSRYAERNQTTTGSRAVRLGIAGSYGPHAFYLFDMDFADDSPEILSASLGWRNKVFGLDYDLRLGNVFNDRGIDGTTSSDATLFSERNVVASAILPQKGFFGVGLYGRLYGPNWHASLSFSGDALDHENSRGDTGVVMSRVHWNPVKTKQGMVHLGLWGFSENITPSPVSAPRNTIIGGRFNTDLRVQSGPLVNLTSSRGVGAELAAAHGPLIAWGEYGRRHARFRTGEPVSSFDTKAWALSAAWMVTGEKAPYSARTGIMDFPEIERTVFDGGTGAVALAARYERLDYSDLPTGGTGDAVNLTGTWYLSSWMRLMVEGGRWTTNNKVGSLIGEDDGYTLKLRSQISF